jgi:hypothetical protein
LIYFGATASVRLTGYLNHRLYIPEQYSTSTAETLIFNNGREYVIITGWSKRACSLINTHAIINSTGTGNGDSVEAAGTTRRLIENNFGVSVFSFSRT